MWKLTMKRSGGYQEFDFKFYRLREASDFIATAASASKSGIEFLITKEIEEEVKENDAV